MVVLDIWICRKKECANIIVHEQTQYLVKGHHWHCLPSSPFVASSLPRGIVTATTVPKGSNVTTPTTATLTPSKPTPSAAAATTSTGTVNSDLQNTDPAQAELGRGKKGVAIDGKTTPLAAPSLDVGGGAPSLLTSQILEAHNLLQLQGATSGTAESAGTDLLEPHPPAAAEQGALNISPELLAQVSSLLNFPIPTAVNNASSAYPLLDCDGVVPTSQGKERATLCG